MILYTPVPQEFIFQGEEEAFTKHTLIELNGLSLVVESISNNQCRIIQLISTNPTDFLNESYLPGTILSLKPEL